MENIENSSADLVQKESLREERIKEVTAFLVANPAELDALMQKIRSSKTEAPTESMEIASGIPSIQELQEKYKDNPKMPELVVAFNKLTAAVTDMEKIGDSGIDRDEVLRSSIVPRLKETGESFYALFDGDDETAGDNVYAFREGLNEYLAQHNLKDIKLVSVYPRDRFDGRFMVTSPNNKSEGRISVTRIYSFAIRQNRDTGETWTLSNAVVDTQ